MHFCSIFSTDKFLKVFFCDILISCFGWNFILRDFNFPVELKSIFGGILISQVSNLNREIFMLLKFLALK